MLSSENLELTGESREKKGPIKLTAHRSYHTKKPVLTATVHVSHPCFTEELGKAAGTKEGRASARRGVGLCLSLTHRV